MNKDITDDIKHYLKVDPGEFLSLFLSPFLIFSRLFFLASQLLRPAFSFRCLTCHFRFSLTTLIPILLCWLWVVHPDISCNLNGIELSSEVPETYNRIYNDTDPKAFTFGGVQVCEASSLGTCVARHAFASWTFSVFRLLQLQCIHDAHMCPRFADGCGVPGDVLHANTAGSPAARAAHRRSGMPPCPSFLGPTRIPYLFFYLWAEEDLSCYSLAGVAQRTLELCGRGDWRAAVSAGGAVCWVEEGEMCLRVGSGRKAGLRDESVMKA